MKDRTKLVFTSGGNFKKGFGILFESTMFRMNNFLLVSEIVAASKLSLYCDNRDDFKPSFVLKHGN